MNARVPRPDARTRCHAFGLSIDEQSQILNQMTDLMKNMKAIGRTSLLPFQVGRYFEFIFQKKFVQV